MIPQYVLIRAKVLALNKKQICLEYKGMEKWVPIQCFNVWEQSQHEQRKYKQARTYDFRIINWWAQKEGW